MAISPLFTGCAAALITPFNRDGTLDEQSLAHLVRRQREAGMDALVLLGTTGEPSTISMEERERIIRIGLAEAGSMPVIVGTGSNDTKKAIAYAKQAYDLGAAGQLVVTPFYNKTTQAGLLRHYDAIADAAPLPMILYNVPARTGMTIAAETAARLSVHPGIVGIKEASGNPALCPEIIERTKENLPVYCGNDDQILPMMAQGAVGAISVVANVLPAQTRAITKACLGGCMEQARDAQNALLPLIRALFSQVSPIPVKATLAMMDLCEDVLRLPLVPMELPQRNELRALLNHLGLVVDHP